MKACTCKEYINATILGYFPISHMLASICTDQCIRPSAMLGLGQLWTAYLTIINKTSTNHITNQYWVQVFLLDLTKIMARARAMFLAWE